MMKLWSVYSSFSRFFLSLAVASSGMIGWVAQQRRLDSKAFMVFSGIFLLSNSASALNQYQERELDRLIPRTQTRPFPACAISRELGWLFIIATCLSGLGILFWGANGPTAFLGAFNFLWYSAVYTPSKTKTKYAVFLGAVCGALPPMMGWTAAGGSILDPKILSMALFIFLWQIPHVFLLQLKYQDDFRAAGIPLMLAPAPPATLPDSAGKNRRMLFGWIVATLASASLFPFLGVVTGTWPVLILGIANGLVLLYSFYSLFLAKEAKVNPLGRSLHAYQLIIFALIIIASLR